jgi:hypothetical protein
MACDCLRKIADSLAKDKLHARVEMCTQMETGKQRTMTRFYHDEKHGSKLREKKSFITHDYCPFCGRKYDEEVKTEKCESCQSSNVREIPGHYKKFSDPKDGDLGVWHPPQIVCGDCGHIEVLV